MFSSKVRFGAVILSTLVLSACQTVGFWDDVHSGLGSYKGQHINTLVAVIGYPDTTNVVGGQKVHVWKNAFAQEYSTSTTTTTLESRNVWDTNLGDYGGELTTEYINVPTTTIETGTHHYACKVTVLVNKSDVITNADLVGDRKGCLLYGDPLQQIVKSRRDREKAIAKAKKKAAKKVEAAAKAKAAAS